MSVHVLSWVLRESDATLGARLVLIVLADHARDDGSSAYPSVKSIGEKARLSERAVQKALRKLEADRSIVSEGQSPYGTTSYRIVLEGGAESTGGRTSEQGGVNLTTENVSRSSPNPSSNPSDKPSSLVQEAIEKVWRHYVTRPGKRERPLPDEERKVIRNALKVATVDEIIYAIDRCWESDYHMKLGRYRDRDGPKYNRLSQIIKGRQGKETTRERIEFWLEREPETSGVAGSGFPSVDPAVIARRKQDVQRGHRLKGDRIAMKKAEEAEAWLRKHGYETIRGEDGYPTFRPLDRP
jgi:hypothetical protein